MSHSYIYYSNWEIPEEGWSEKDIEFRLDVIRQNLIQDLKKKELFIEPISRKAK